MPPSPIHPSIHLYPFYSNSTCSFSSTAALLGSAKVLLLWWWSNATTSSIQSSLDLFSRPPAQGQMKGSSLGRQQNESRERRPFIRSVLLKFFLLCRSPLSPQKVCASVSINTLKIILASSSFSSFLILLSSNHSTLDVVICHWCRGLAEGRKKGRKHQLSD